MDFSVGVSEGRKETKAQTEAAGASAHPQTSLETQGPGHSSHLVSNRAACVRLHAL